MGNSHSFELWSKRKKQPGDHTNPLSINYKTAYHSDTYMLNRPHVFTEQNENLSLEILDKGNSGRPKLKKQLLRNTNRYPMST